MNRVISFRSTPVFARRVHFFCFWGGWGLVLVVGVVGFWWGGGGVWFFSASPLFFTAFSCPFPSPWRRRLSTDQLRCPVGVLRNLPLLVFKLSSIPPPFSFSRREPSAMSDQLSQMYPPNLSRAPFFYGTLLYLSFGFTFPFAKTLLYASCLVPREFARFSFSTHTCTRKAWAHTQYEVF